MTMDDMTIEGADRASRHWGGDDLGPIRLGSERHKILFSRMLLDTFNPYKPAVIDWPKLDADARDRLVGLPIWDIAVQTEGKASLNVRSYAATVADNLLREAIELNGFEEARHKTVSANLVAAYGIALAPEPDYVIPRDPEWAFMVTGSDPRLLRPRFVPAAVRLASRVMVKPKPDAVAIGSPAHKTLRLEGVDQVGREIARAPRYLEEVELDMNLSFLAIAARGSSGSSL
jgi:hypothetical protein